MGTTSSRHFNLFVSLTEQEKENVLHYNVTINGIADKIRCGDIKNIIVMSGAGISVASGIVDFRSPDTGLYNTLGEFSLPCPEAIFSIQYFKKNPKPFYTLISRYLFTDYYPNVTHFFITLLQRKGVLLRNYTQNVDNLELQAGLPSEFLIHAHGTLLKAHCVECGKVFSIMDFRDALKTNMNLLRCSTLTNYIRNKDRNENFTSKNVSRPHTKEITEKPRSVADSQETTRRKSGAVRLCNKSYVFSSILKMKKVQCQGLVKPDIIFFGEQLPEQFFKMMQNDFPKADLLIVIGTSATVQPFAQLIDMVSLTCPRLLINLEVVGLSSGRGSSGFQFYRKENYRDVLFQGRCEDGVKELARSIGWEKELEDMCLTYEKPSADAYWNRILSSGENICKYARLLDRETMKSDLTKQEFFEETYRREYLYSTPSNCTGEQWYQSECEKIVDYLCEIVDVKQTSLLDVGCGNGLFLIDLAERGFIDITGCDYAKFGITLTKQNCLFWSGKHPGSLTQFHLALVDILDPSRVLDVDHSASDQVDVDCQAVVELSPQSLFARAYDLIVDKGTFDVFLMQEKVSRYILNLCNLLLKNNSLVCVTSCNATRDELINSFLRESVTGWKFCVYAELLHPSITFGGSEGQTVTTIIFRAQQH